MVTFLLGVLVGWLVFKRPAFITTTLDKIKTGVVPPKADSK